MKTFLTVGFALGLTFLAALQPLTAQAPAKADPAIAKLSKEFVAAFNAKDAARVASLYTQDAVMMPGNQPTVHGRANIEAWFKNQFAAGASEIALTPIESATSGAQGYETGGYSITIKPASGAPMTVKGRYFVLLKQVGGQWRVAFDIDNTEAPVPPPPSQD